MVFIVALLLVTLAANMPPSIIVNILTAKMLASVPLSNSPEAFPSSIALDYYNDNLAPNEMGGCPLLNFGTEADDTNPDLKQRVAKMIRKRMT